MSVMLHHSNERGLECIQTLSAYLDATSLSHHARAMGRSSTNNQLPNNPGSEIGVSAAILAMSRLLFLLPDVTGPIQNLIRTELILGICDVCNKAQSLFLSHSSGSLGLSRRSPEIAESEGRQEGIAASALAYSILHT